MEAPKHILAIRFSAMGDVAMLVPVIKNLLQQYPSVQITVVSNTFFEPIFQNIPRCSFHPASLKKNHKGIIGLWRLYREINKANKIDAVADMHNVLRSKIIRSFFTGKASAVIDKGRAEKKQLTSKHHKQLRQLKSSHQRYADVLAGIGFPIQLNVAGSFLDKQPLPENLRPLFSLQKKLVGVAPFAQHPEKMYPLEKLKETLQQLSKDASLQVCFFGGKEEALELAQWQTEFPGTINIAGKISFADELKVISNLSLMLSMDSANMHLARLYNVPVVSIWGATHPFAGFAGWAMADKNIVQADLYCRPCSIFGNKKCYRGDHACMHLITPLMILDATNYNV